MDGLLTPKLRGLLEAAIKKGVPPITAGLMYGIRHATMTRWIRLGMQEAIPPKPEFPTRMCDVGNGWKVAEGDYYKHELECRKLADCIMKSEGALVAKLCGTLWKASTGKYADLATSRFMFTKYTRSHGVEPEEATHNLTGEDDDGGGEDAVQIILPDNGRLTKA